MKTIEIKFIAYIPKSLGKPLSSYFLNDPLFKPKMISNYQEFKRKLEDADKQSYTWLPEPGNMLSHYYFGTDEVNSSHTHNNHTVRLSVNMSLKIDKIGNYTLNDSHDIFRHPCGNSNQHSDASHRIEAYIRPKLQYYGQGKSGAFAKDLKYEGICGPILHQTSIEDPLKKNIYSTVSGTYFIQPGNRVRKDSTIIEASASAAYPFLEKVAQNIDFTIKAKIYLKG